MSVANAGPTRPATPAATMSARVAIRMIVFLLNEDALALRDDAAVFGRGRDIGYHRLGESRRGIWACPPPSNRRPLICGAGCACFHGFCGHGCVFADEH